MLAGDTQGFPNGRRLADDVMDIELRVIGGFLKGNKLPLGDGVDQNDKSRSATTFPYVAAPNGRLRLAAQALRAGARADPRRPRGVVGPGWTRRGGGAATPPPRWVFPTG